MPLFGQSKQKVKTRSIFADGQSESQNETEFDIEKSNLDQKIKSIRSKVKFIDYNHNMNPEHVQILVNDKEDDSSNDVMFTNLNPLIVYEAFDLKNNPVKNIDEVILKQKSISKENKQIQINNPKTLQKKLNNINFKTMFGFKEDVQNEDESILETDQVIQNQDYQDFKQANLTTKYKNRLKLKKFGYFVLIFGIISLLVFSTWFRVQSIQKHCNELLIAVNNFSTYKSDDLSCQAQQPSTYLTLGIPYQKQVDEVEVKAKEYVKKGDIENDTIKVKILDLYSILGVKNGQLGMNLAENKARYDELVKSRDSQLSFFGIKLKQALLLDETFDESKSKNELLGYSKFNPADQITSINNLNSKIEELSKKIDPNKLKDILKYKYFLGDDWKYAFEKAKVNYQNVSTGAYKLDFFGDSKANAVITEIAEKRGFSKRYLVRDESQLVDFEGYKLQKPMAEALKNLFKEMRDNKLKVELISGYRGIYEQSEIFKAEFKAESQELNNGKEFSVDEVIARKADQAINKVLELIALPGYSRHHFGYTIDITEPGTNFKEFDKTKSYEWMAKDNFFNVKKYGIIPSYPNGVQEQGPEPESWEFIYVGTDYTLTTP